MKIESRHVDIDGLYVHHLVGGEGSPLVLLHSDGDSAASWCWVLSALARKHRVYAPDLPGFGGSSNPDADYSPTRFATFLTAFLNTLRLERATLIGNSLGGRIALHSALSDPGRVAALVLVDSAGLGREVSPALRLLTLPGVGDVAITWSKTAFGASQRAWSRGALLFASYDRIPTEWLREQYRLAQLPGFLEATLASLRELLEPDGQREPLLNQMHRLTMPVLIIWGTEDLVVPAHQARAARARLGNGMLALIPNCGHMPQVERPQEFVAALDKFLDAYQI